MFSIFENRFSGGARRGKEELGGKFGEPVLHSIYTLQLS
jgi:hypothetical protein